MNITHKIYDIGLGLPQKGELVEFEGDVYKVIDIKIFEKKEMAHSELSFVCEKDEFEGYSDIAGLYEMDEYDYDEEEDDEDDEDDYGYEEEEEEDY
jgi:hypothetical protein